MICEAQVRKGFSVNRLSQGGLSSIKLAVIVGALGVVFGDIGTSPIYTLQTVFNPGDSHEIPVTTENLLGVVSLIVWSVILIVTITYVSLAMKMDNEGEGGIMALITLIPRWIGQSRTRTIAVLTGLGILGASLFLGDSMITPAISVLSAVQGLNVLGSGFADDVVPITATILIILFVIQRFGTSAVGRAFGPVMLVWFGVIAALGVVGIVHDPEILLALLPTYALGFMATHFMLAFFALTAVVLAVTGGEALYADMGHFGRKPIRLAWLFLVFPACALSYLGQGALILQNRSNLSAPFFLLAPHWAQLPLIILATAATVIASQAVISGAFSVAAQASQLGFLPRLRVLHTSSSSYGQIYVPWINWLLMVCVLTLVFAFRTSNALAYAYGMAVIGTTAITTFLFFFLARRRWKTPVWVLIVGGTILIGFDLLLFVANMTKLVSGAWLPLAIALCCFIVMMTWNRGRTLVTTERNRVEIPLGQFAREKAKISEIFRVPGTAIFLARNPGVTPLALIDNLTLNHVLHEKVIILSVIMQTVPRVPEDQRYTIAHPPELPGGVTQLILRFGYDEEPHVPRALAMIAAAEPDIATDLEDAVYFVSYVEGYETTRPGMARWRKRLYLATAHIAIDASDAFQLPRKRVIMMGTELPL